MNVIPTIITAWLTIHSHNNLTITGRCDDFLLFGGIFFGRIF